ncbi:putative actin binding protein [Cavenderia fasciculata]|uniref:Coactosin n=1 Tax=Cavenderia fasciculata TaxID=261658 RepID=F4PSK4_CACFS|nr:putative actin binding protein [Cavenderia fasciculata]EGG20696.1 putative actin binding protein [Cavenderia fasciculata]|eukprot:XP_004358546.1 putative actin binding protein [Cavenderia fasciculata]
MSVQFINESEIKSAIADVRTDKTPTDWVLLSFEDNKSKKIKLAGSGSGGVAELVQHLEDTTVGWGLVRKIDRIDESETVKFAFISFIGEKVGIMQKAFVSIATGSIKPLIAPYQSDFNITNPSEISDEVVLQKIRETSGSGSRVLDESGQKLGAAGSGSTNSPSGARRSFIGSAPSSAGKDAVALGDEPAIRAALKEFRADNSGINWVLFGYEGGNSNTIVLLGSGSGGPTELISHLDDSTVGYGLVRVVEKIDNSNTVKFAFIQWTGDNIPRMLRARLGTHSGVVKQLVTPYHVDIKASSKSEISEDIIVDTITKNSGTQSRVLADQPRSTTSASTGGGFRQFGSSVSGTSSGGSYKGPSSVPTSTGAPVKVDDEVRAAIKDVRNDQTATTWALIGYKPDNSTLTVIATGSGSVDELAPHLSSSIVAYGLVREVERFDLSDTVKFVFLNFVGEDIPRMFRAKLGTHSGVVKETFAPFHVDFQASQASEVTADSVTKTISSNSGTSSRVINK